ncbi:hypothetical protein [Bradyrhizobium sp.]|jgi:hypothetical protein|nr:hypothetical protein [Bradyrhizobium sp.]
MADGNGSAKSAVASPAAKEVIRTMKLQTHVDPIDLLVKAMMVASF